MLLLLFVFYYMILIHWKYQLLSGYFYNCNSSQNVSYCANVHVVASKYPTLYWTLTTCKKDAKFGDEFTKVLIPDTVRVFNSGNRV